MSFFNQLASGVAAAADKLDDAQPAAPAAAAPAPAADAPAAAAPAAAAPAEGAPAAAAPDAAAPAAAAPATGEEPVDIKATLLHAADAAKQGNYMDAVQDVMKTGIVQKLAAQQGSGQAAGGSDDVVGNLMNQAQGLLGSLGGADDAKPASDTPPAQ
jgi:2-oxoglutarate dehydrogenase E2 component (dihydrolipoamide succinyltransferase)